MRQTLKRPFVNDENERDFLLFLSLDLLSFFRSTQQTRTKVKVYQTKPNNNLCYRYRVRSKKKELSYFYQLLMIS